VRIENSFIPVEGVGERTERKLWRAGVTTWDDFDGSVVGSTTADRIETFIADARDHLAASNAAFFAEQFPSGSQWRFYENFREHTCFLDIETTGLDHHSDDVTVVGLHQAGETEALVRGQDLTADRLRSQLSDAEMLVTFNGKRFDVPFLEAEFDLAVDLPHLDLMYPCRQLGLTGGLKPIEKQVGIDRDRPDLSGRDAVRLWREYQRGDDAALETLVSYNRDDTANMERLVDVVTDRLHQDVFVTD
jgi:uncharacterized protein YprB with RNaseH-like and TPR domain